jgi:2-polyprenyl-3-methyl-5-hydroxy-6-metoxy-1,4-benzoquinol methylase
MNKIGYFTTIWRNAFYLNIENILSLLVHNKNASVIDIGCGGGEFTTMYKKKIGAKEITGADGVKNKLIFAKKHGVDKTICFDLSGKWPIKSNTYDVVISDQVIEHLYDYDIFISETHRILKPGGYAVISTENLSSWHNIFALILGYQDFSHQLIRKKHVGNSLSLHKDAKTGSWSNEETLGVDDSDYPHMKVPTFISLRQVFEAYGFKYIEGKGAGYHPLPGFLAKLAAKIDPYHSHFITIKFKK